VRRLATAQLRAGLSGPHPAQDLRLHVRSLTGDLEGPSVEAVCGEALAIAGRKVMAAAGIVSLEPYVACVVSCPADTLSGALADLRSRGAEIAAIDHVDGHGEVRGELPLARVLGYATQLRSLTRGLGAVHLRPLGLRPGGGDASVDEG
jgi:elongation factor G